MASQGRFTARLARLPHEALAELAASLRCTNEATRRTADSTLALHDPTPAWAIDRILTSPDLVQCIFAHVEMQDHAGARVCKAWKRGWDATDGQRRGLRLAELAEPDFEVRCGILRAGLPGERLCYAYGSNLRIVEEKMQTLRVHEMAFGVADVGASEDGLLYVCLGHPTLRRYRLEEDSRQTLQVEYEDTRDEEERYNFFTSPSPASDGVLFAVGERSGHDEIVAFDAATLTVRNRFGRDLFGEEGAYDMVVVGDELYVTDPSNHCIRVFSMSGEHLREIRGDWRQPDVLLCVRDRLYMTEEVEEEGPEDETAEQKKDRLVAGKRIFVLTPQGETLQKYRFGESVHTMAVLGDKLVVMTGSGKAGTPATLHALKGL